MMINIFRRRSTYSAIVVSMILPILFGCGESNPNEINRQEEVNSEENAVSDTPDNVAQVERFFTENAGKEGIIVTASGLQYEIVTEGSGKSPELSDTVVTHYAGRFLDGTEFDSSIKRGKPASFRVSGVIKGWTEALQLMREGDKWRLYIPPDLAYGERGAGPIPANSALIFDIELIEVK